MASPPPRSAKRVDRRVDRDLRAIGAITQAILDGDDIERLLSRVASEARALARAASGVVVTVAADTGEMTFRAVEGLTTGPLRLGNTMPAAGTLTELALEAGQNIVARTAADIPPRGRGFARATGTGPLIASPLAGIGATRGVLVVARLEGAAPFRPADIQLVSTFAVQAGNAIDLYELRAVEVDQALRVERQRIARDLHDGVVQSLFGLGMTLRALGSRMTDGTALASLDEAVEALDESIAIVRSYIGALTPRPPSVAAPEPPGRADDSAPSPRSEPPPSTGSRDAIGALGDLARASAADRPADAVFDELVHGIAERVDGWAGVLATLTEDGEHLLIRSRHGPSIRGRDRGDILPIEESLLGEGIRRARPYVIASFDEFAGPAPDNVRQTVGPIAVVPLVIRGRVLGAFSSARPRGAPPFSRSEISLIEAYGSQAAIALEFERVRDELRRGVVSAERDRIGRDLHGRVIQLLFGVGLTLQGLEAGARDASSRTSLRAAVEVLDRSIRDLRRYVFDLGPSLVVERRLHEELEAMAEELMTGAGIQLEMDINREASTRLVEVAGDVVQIAREALSNVVRHAGARTCMFRVFSRDGRVVLEVTDDGSGVRIDRPGSGHGLANMRARARAIEADLDIHGSPGQGTTVRMSVPV